MNIYDQRGGGDNHSTPPHSYPQPPPSTNQAVQNVQTVQPNYWQPPPNQIPVSGGKQKAENISELSPLLLSLPLFFRSLCAPSMSVYENQLFSAPADHVLRASSRNNDLSRSESRRQAAAAPTTEVPDELLLQRANDDSSEPSELCVNLSH